MAPRLFGTDGVRGPVGEVLTPELALSLGRAAVSLTTSELPRVLIIRDTRESGPMLSAAIAAGVAEAGGDAYLGGVLPTPAASIIARREGFDLAAVVSASHNPWGDNGIKFFGPDGTKLDDDQELAIEAGLERPPAEGSRRSGRIRQLYGALDDYIRALGQAFDLDLSGRRIVLDCANGAAVRAAPTAFARFGADVVTMSIAPDGRNINEACGSTHIDAIADQVASSDAEIGFAFDGDADRVLAVDAEGRLFDGDEIVALAAIALAERGELDGGVAVTVMSNYAFHQAMEAAGIEVATTKVGDRHVIAELLRRGWSLGGEQSGHIIWTDFAATGDGIAAALLVMSALGERTLAEARPFEKLPQRLENVELAKGAELDRAERLWGAVASAEEKLSGRGRVLVRPSGTEPVVRLMVEAPSVAECDEVLSDLVGVARSELG